MSRKRVDQDDLFGDGGGERYPDTPGFMRGADTSEEAAESMIGEAPHLRALVYAEIWKSAKHPTEPGLTCENIEDILAMKHQTASARITELLLGRHIEIVGRRENRSLRDARVYLPRKRDTEGK